MPPMRLAEKMNYNDKPTYLTLQFKYPNFKRDAKLMICMNLLACSNFLVAAILKVQVIDYKG